MSDTYNSIVGRLTGLMADLTAPEAALLAQHLTSHINQLVAAAALGLPFESNYIRTEEVERAMPRHLMNFATLDAPWAAYRQAHGPRDDRNTADAIPTRLICSVPESLSHWVRATDSPPLWSGSLLDALAMVLDGAKYEVLIINPYWSILGVEALFRRLSRASFEGVELTIMTQPEERFDALNLEGMRCFVDGLNGMGGNCTVFAPSPSLKPIPMLHAKAIVADRSQGYLGSANLTGSGMDFSVEIGVVLGGILARQLADWMSGLVKGLIRCES